MIQKVMTRAMRTTTMLETSGLNKRLADQYISRKILEIWRIERVLANYETYTPCDLLSNPNKPF